MYSSAAIAILIISAAINTMSVGGLDSTDNADIAYSENLSAPFDKSFEVHEMKKRQVRQAPTTKFNNNNNNNDEDDPEPHLPESEEAGPEDDEDEVTHNGTMDNGKHNESAWMANATTETVSYKYYSLVVHSPTSNKFDEFWQDTAALAQKKGVEAQHKQLSNSYRRAVSQKLSFKFPFYGHYTENITIATGGFVYVGEHVHSWLAATQYIAPLMANFDTTGSTDANVFLVDTGDMFVVEWNQVVLRHQADVGNFTFQVVLHKNGDIWFVYKTIPVSVKKVSDLHHPLKVGLSDAYLFTHTILAMSRRVIYEYHRIELPVEEVRSQAVFEIKALPVCLLYQSCSACMNATLHNFNCSWCATTAEQGGSFCSDEAGLHRRRQEWLTGNCNKQLGQVYCSDENQEKSASTSSEKGEKGEKQQQNGTSTSDRGASGGKGGKETSTMVPDRFVPITSKSRKPVAAEATPQKPGHAGMSSGAVVALLFILGTVTGLVGWMVYAYYNPHTPSGQFLIRYRPRNWRLPGNHGDVRYTASVHM